MTLEVAFFSGLLPAFGASRFFVVTVADTTFGGVKACIDVFKALSSCLSFVTCFGGSVSFAFNVASLCASSLDSATGTGVWGTEFPGVAVGSAFTCGGGGEATGNLASSATGNWFGDKCRIGSVRSAERTCMASKPSSVG